MSAKSVYSICDVKKYTTNISNVRILILIGKTIWIRTKIFIASRIRESGNVSWEVSLLNLFLLFGCLEQINKLGDKTKAEFLQRNEWKFWGNIQGMCKIIPICFFWIFAPADFTDYMKNILRIFWIQNEWFLCAMPSPWEVHSGAGWVCIFDKLPVRLRATW